MPSRRSDRQDRPVVVLVGMMGAGKTSVGREFAGRSEFVDLDKLIEQQSGRTIREIFETDGESAFRKLELQALRDATTSGHYKVVSTGGGDCYHFRIAAVTPRDGCVCCVANRIQRRTHAEGNKEWK